MISRFCFPSFLCILFSMRENRRGALPRGRFLGRSECGVSTIALPIRLSASRLGSSPLTILFVLASGAGMMFLSGRLHLLDAWTEVFRSSAVLRWAACPFLISAGIVLAGSVFRMILSAAYKPEALEGVRKADWPHVTVIMAALNEGEFVEQAIDSIFASRYPKDRLEVVCVDDGSKDETLAGMMKSREKHGERIFIIRFKKNLGKRKAICSALKKSRGQVVITFDSDSKLDRSAIRNIVVPLMKDGKTGAVAGRVAVLNENENLLTRMLSSRYSLSFDYGRSYQSVYGAVLCCPGALTAFRKDVLEKISKELLTQKFLNSPCRQGEDRALTTLVLKAGYLVKYQSNALVFTKVPRRFKQVNRMYVRWTRSHIRESLQFARFMFLPYRTKYNALPVFDFLFLNILPPFHLMALAIASFAAFVNPMLVTGTLGFFAVLSFLFSLAYLRNRGYLAAFCGAAFIFISVFTQWWIFPYSALTIKNESWLTR